MEQNELENKARIFDEIRKVMGVGDKAGDFVVVQNVKNCKDFSEKLNAIEQSYFMIAGDVDEEYPDCEPDLVCMVNRWGDSKDEYVKSFGEALNKIYKYDELIAENAKQQELITKQAKQLKMLRKELKLSTYRLDAVWRNLGSMGAKSQADNNRKALEATKPVEE